MPPETPIEIVFSFDTTGSMYGYLKIIKDKLRDIIQRLLGDMTKIRIAVFAHGDYCDFNKYVTKHIDFTQNVKKLCEFVKKVKPTSGGDWEECYELVLRQSRELLSWSPGTQRALVMIGDAIPHPPTDPQNKDNIDWKEEASKLRDELGVRIYSVQASALALATPFWTELACLTNGKHLKLGQFDTISDVMISICYKERGAGYLEAYEKEVRSREGSGIRPELDHMFTDLKDGDTPLMNQSASGSTSAAPAPAPKEDDSSTPSDHPITRSGKRRKNKMNTKGSKQRISVRKTRVKTQRTVKRLK